MTDRIRTHWTECWRSSTHHACAVARIERLEKRVVELEGVILRAADALTTMDDSGLSIDQKIPLADVVGMAEEIRENK